MNPDGQPMTTAIDVRPDGCGRMSIGGMAVRCEGVWPYGHSALPVRLKNSWPFPRPETALFRPFSASSERQRRFFSSLRGANKRAYFGKISGHAMSPLFFGGTKTPTIPLFRGKRRRCAGDSINLLLVVWLLPLRGVGYTIQMIMKGKDLKRRRYFPFPFSLG